MRTTVISLLALLGIVTVGCSTPPPAAKTAMKKCIPETLSADTCEYSPPANPNKAVCHIHVGGNKDSPLVYPYDLFVSKGVRNITVVWTLLDPGATFRDNSDGPNFGGNNEFSDGGTTNDPNGGPPHGGPAKHYTIKFKNSPTGRSHPYTITFKPAVGEAISCDPTITNGGG